MKIMSFNVNGLRARIKDNTIFEIIELEKPDILCLQEIKCKEKILKILSKNKFNISIPIL